MTSQPFLEKEDKDRRMEQTHPYSVYVLEPSARPDNFFTFLPLRLFHGRSASQVQPVGTHKRWDRREHFHTHGVLLSCSLMQLHSILGRGSLFSSPNAANSLFTFPSKGKLLIRQRPRGGMIDPRASPFSLLSKELLIRLHLRQSPCRHRISCWRIEFRER